MNTNRPGGDYQNFEIRSPGECQSSCLHDARCKAWTWVKRGIQGPGAHCWLKDSVPGPVPDKNCVSGRKGGATL
ncbi:PAN domain-containing protein [Bradyrhizobium sp. STM 3562]|uniref:PAN domain-containing protein n=1 Tax=Bradyrhizobium sp. STM 3562 TaxID=578924 RepID=UPI00388D9C0A